MLHFNVVTFEDAVNNTRRTKWVGHVARTGERRDACKVLVGNIITWNIWA